MHEVKKGIKTSYTCSFLLLKIYSEVIPEFSRLEKFGYVSEKPTFPLLFRQRENARFNI
jgi:hypothetical protein